MKKYNMSKKGTAARNVGEAKETANKMPRDSNTCSRKSSRCTDIS